MTDLPKSSSTSTIASNNVPVDSPTKPNRLVALKDRLGAVDDLLISSVLKTAGALPTGGKEPLSLQATSVNFRRFVQKSGPLFVAQDAAEAVLNWDDTPTTVFFGAVYALLCWYPLLLLLVPNVVLASILLSTYNSRALTVQGETITQAPPAEGSVDYLANLQNIQIMMGRLSDLSDFGRSLVPYLTWHQPHERTSLILLQLSVLTSFALFLVLPIIPWRLVFLIAGLGALGTNHPVVKALLAEASPYVVEGRKKIERRVRRLVEDDGLSDEDLEREIKEVVRIELESVDKRDLGGWSVEVVQGGELEKGWRWLKGSEWVVEEGKGRVDALGYAYIYLDGTSGPTAMPEGGGPVAQSRRRRLVRRAVNYSDVQ